MKQALHQACALAPILFKSLFAVVLTLVLQHLSEDPEILVDLVHLCEPTAEGVIEAPEGSEDPLAKVLWGVRGMLYADDAHRSAIAASTLLR